MSRILLVSTNTCSNPNPVYPLGMAHVAASMIKHGHVVEQFDYLASGKNVHDLIDIIKTFLPNITGISIRNIDNVDSISSDEGWFLKKVKDLVSAIKDVSLSPIVAGGPAFSLLPREILDYTGADYGIVGEGEILFPDFIRKMENGMDLPEITYPSGQMINGKQIISPLYNKKLVSYYFNKSGMVGIQTKRGCTHNCFYCSYPALEGNYFRYREPDAVVDDMIILKKDFGVNSFFFTDSVFNDPEGRYMMIAEEILKNRLDIKWSAFFTPMGMDAKALKLMKRSGLYALEMGTDAASDHTLSGINKRFCFSDVIAVNKLCREAGLPVAHFVMFGGPGETQKTVHQGLDNLNKLEGSVVFAYSGIRILPGTVLYSKAVQSKICSRDDSLLKPVYYFSREIDPDDMNNFIKESFSGKRDRIFPPSIDDRKIKALNSMGFKGLLWDNLIKK